MALDKSKLIKLKEEIDEAKSEVAKLSGKKEHLMGQLKETYGCNSLKEAEAKVEKLTKKIEDLDKQITKALSDLESKLPNEKEDDN